MKVEIVSTRLVKPLCDGAAGEVEVPLSVLDKVNYDLRVGLLFGFRSPSPTVASMERGLAVVLSKYRECAGRLGKDAHGRPALLLKDGGVKFVEAVVDEHLDESLLFEPSSALLSLHPSFDDEEELVQAQVTRFKCGSSVLGVVVHHYLNDGPSCTNFLVAWGQATRGLAVDPPTFLGRTSAFSTPCKDLQTHFEHRGVEFLTKEEYAEEMDGSHQPHGEVAVSRVHFSEEFVAKVKQTASADGGRQYSTFVSLQAHIWRAMTKARQHGSKLKDDETTNLKFSVNGRPHLGLPREFFGNAILWGRPTTTVKSLVDGPLEYAASIIHEEVAKLKEGYFRSFINFASSDIVQKENLVPSTLVKPAYFPDVVTDCLLKFPFHQMDFGTGTPFGFLMSYYPFDGLLFLFPSFCADGGIDALLSMFQKDMEVFKNICYDLQ